MNITTRPIEDDEYDAIIETIRDGFEFGGISHKPNPRIAMALQLERNLGLRISDVLRLTLVFSRFVNFNKRNILVELSTL